MAITGKEKAAMMTLRFRRDGACTGKGPGSRGNSTTGVVTEGVKM